MYKCYFILLIYAFTYLPIFSQQDSVQLALPSFEKRPMIAALGGLGVNVIINRIDAWPRDLDWAKVTPQNWIDNLRYGLDTDGDSFVTNFFAHPVQGSFYFNSARHYGMSFIESMPFVLFGSLTWEFFGETYPASEIDLNTTTTAGIYLGEITHRLTAHLLRNDKNRNYRVLRNAAATIINPLAQIDGLLYADVSQSFRRKDQKIVKVRSQLASGYSFYLHGNTGQNRDPYFHINYSLIYGEFFNSDEAYQPFDFFILRTSADLSTFESFSKNFASITSHAPLWKLDQRKRSIISVSSHYDFLHNPVFKIGNISLSLDYHLDGSFRSTRWLSSIKAGPIIFGSASSEVVEVIELFVEDDGEFLRDYIYGRGFLLEFEMFFDSRKYGRIISSFNNWTIYTHSDTPGTERSSVIQVEYYYPVFNNFSIGLEYFKYHRNAHYSEHVDYQNITNGYQELKILGNYTF